MHRRRGGACIGASRDPGRVREVPEGCSLHAETEGRDWSPTEKRRVSPASTIEVEQIEEEGVEELAVAEEEKEEEPPGVVVAPSSSVSVVWCVEFVFF